MSTSELIQLPMTSGEGRVAFITGGTEGIGKEAARGLVKVGATVILAARRADAGEAAAAELTAEGPGKALFLKHDVASAASLAEAVAYIDKSYGKLDILINNAADGDPPRSAFDVPVEIMRRVYETNVFAVMAAIQSFHALLERSVGGRIVNVSSERATLQAGVISPWLREKSKSTAAPGTMASRIAFVTRPNISYSTSKTALNAITQHFAYELELRGSKIKINAAAPGHCATAFNNFKGWRTPAEGARIIIMLALLDSTGPQGGFFKEDGPADW